MELEIPKDQIIEQLKKQLSMHFLLSNDEQSVIDRYVDGALEKCEYNFQMSDNKYFRGGGQGAYFSPYHSVQYMMFLYYLSHDIYTHGESMVLCDKIYYLNKIFHSVDLFYAINLPDEFGAEHPLGSVMGRATYGNGFFFYQGCTVGGTKAKDGTIRYPELGTNVRMYANSCILGRSKVGNNVQIGAGALVKDQNIPSNCIVFGQSPNLIIKYR